MYWKKRTKATFSPPTTHMTVIWWWKVCKGEHKNRQLQPLQSRTVNNPIFTQSICVQQLIHSYISVFVTPPHAFIHGRRNACVRHIIDFIALEW